MKKATMILAVLSTMITVTLSTLPVSSVFLNSDNIVFNASEYEKILKESVTNFDGKFDNEKFYTCYSLDGLHEFSKGVYDAVNFKDIICGEPRAYVQVADRLITIFDRDGKLSVVGETLPLGYMSVVDLNKEEEKLRKQLDEEIVDVKYCGYVGYGCIYLSVIYFKTVSGRELCVPYIDNYNCGKSGERFNGIIENGKFYSGSELIEILKKIIPVIENTEFNDGKKVPDILIIGDANYDGIINSRDCSYIVRQIASRNNDSLPDTVDYNKDGKKNVRDAAAIAADLSKLTYGRRD